MRWRDVKDVAVDFELVGFGAEEVVSLSAVGLVVVVVERVGDAVVVARTVLETEVWAASWLGTSFCSTAD